MRTRLTAITATGATALLGSLLAAAPADAQSVTFSLTGGGISIAEPSGAAALTGGALAGLAGTSLTGALGSTVVTDLRGGVIGWSSKITGTTAFSNSTTTIPVTAAKAWVPGAVAFTGVVTPTAGTYLTEATGLALTGAAQPLVTATAVVGNNTATFTPSIAVAVPANATAGDYTGAVTQTVS